MTSEDAYTSQAAGYWMSEIIKIREPVVSTDEIDRTTNDRVSRPKIQRVPPYLGAREELEKFYKPNFVSFGPTHFAKPYVELGVDYKIRWTRMFLRRTNQTYDSLVERIGEALKEILGLFDPKCWENWKHDVNKGCYCIHDCSSLDVMVVDGCSILEILDKDVYDQSDELEDPEVDYEKVFQDMLLLENQIPFKVLKLLCNDDTKLQRHMDTFLQIWSDNFVDIEGRFKLKTSTDEHTVRVQLDEEHGHDPDPVHLLDLVRRALLAREGDIQKDIQFNRKLMNLKKYRTRTIQELKAVGIRVSCNVESLYPAFIAGQLILPCINVFESTAVLFHNMIAYEMCPDFRNNFEVSSLIVFLSSLIEQPEDVKELWHAEILYHGLPNDKEVTDLFNSMAFVSVPENNTFAGIRNQILEHLESRRRRIKVLGWMREAYQTYFRSPWTIIALFAATLGLVLTFIQTWFAINPKAPQLRSTDTPL